MAGRKIFKTGSSRVWTVEELGAFYSENRASLISHANRLLKDSARAEEVVQDALIRVILASPELNSQEHAISYLHKTVENLCLDIFRVEKRRPHLVVLDEVEAEIEATFSANVQDHADVLSAADDAAIIRQALSLLSPAERAALVMWEVESRSASEIAQELGISEKNVRHTVSRARKSLRRILSEYVIDSERGLTALDLLSTTYRKSVDIAKKSSKAALSLILVFFAFLGFNSLTPDKSSTIESQTKLAVTENSGTANIKNSQLSFAGLDKSGVPIGFTITDNTGALGSLYFKAKDPLLTETDIKLSWLTKTSSGAANLFLSQNLTQEGSNVDYDLILSVGMNGGWVPTNSRVISVNLERLLSGNYLLTAVIQVKSAIESTILIPADADGRDLEVLPQRVVTRVVLNSSKSQIVAQAIQVVERGAK